MGCQTRSRAGARVSAVLRIFGAAVCRSPEAGPRDDSTRNLPLEVAFFPRAILLASDGRLRSAGFGAELPIEDKYTFASGLAASHGERLRRFLATRLRRARQDVPDLVQEVYMRLLRVRRPDSIRNPEAYLFTIASHVLYQHALREGAGHEGSDLVDSIPAEDADSDPAAQAEIQQRLEDVERALAQLSYKAQAALVLYRREGLSLEEVASELNVSVAMVKKYLVKAIVHCRQQMPASE